MDVKNIYVMYDCKKWDYEKVVSELVEEGYKHNFYFQNLTGKLSDNRKALAISDEVWIFGDCHLFDDYQYAKDIGADLWEMG